MVTEYVREERKLESLLAVLIGVALSATAGFRVFTPLLITGLFVRADWLTLSEGFEWIGSTPALLAFIAATVIEVAVNYIPVVGTFVKMISAPAAIIAGVLLTASFIGEMSPFLTWSIAIIAGGGAAGMTHGATTAVKGISETAFASPAISAAEDVTAAVTPVLLFIVPVAAIVFLIIMALVLHQLYKRILLRPEKI